TCPCAVSKPCLDSAIRVNHQLAWSPRGQDRRGCRGSEGAAGQRPPDRPGVWGADALLLGDPAAVVPQVPEDQRGAPAAGGVCQGPRLMDTIKPGRTTRDAGIAEVSRGAA